MDLTRQDVPAWIIAAAVAVGMVTVPTQLVAQTPNYRAPRTADGMPDLNGIWQAMNAAHWDIEPHGCE